jgi:hypothetical protein
VADLASEAESNCTLWQPCRQLLLLLSLEFHHLRCDTISEALMLLGAGASISDFCDGFVYGLKYKSRTFFFFYSFFATIASAFVQFTVTLKFTGYRTGTG